MEILVSIRRAPKGEKVDDKRKWIVSTKHHNMTCTRYYYCDAKYHLYAPDKAEGQRFKNNGESLVGLISLLEEREIVPNTGDQKAMSDVLAAQWAQTMDDIGGKLYCHEQEMLCIMKEARKDHITF
ncbi:MAG: hypothetical protein Q9168_004741 [Polycauliona sp. 1 TL-2023]